MEGVDAHDRIDACAPDGVDVVQHIGKAFFQKPQVLLSVGLWQGPACYHRRSTTVHLQGPDGDGEYRHMWLEAAEPAFYVPELLEPDIRSEAALGDMVVKHLQPDAVADDGRLPYGDIGKGAGVYEAGLILRCTH
jgi:hypothetical protein